MSGYPHEPARTEELPHDRLMAFNRAATVVMWPALAEEGEKPWVVEDFAVVTRELVWEIQRLKQGIVNINEQEGLAEVVGWALADVAGIHDTSWAEDMAIAEAILKAGYGKVEK